MFFHRHTNWTRWTNKTCLISEWLEVTPLIYHYLLKISFWKLYVNVNTIRCWLFYWKSAIRLLVLIIWIIICRIVFLSFCFCFVYSFRMLQITGKWQSQSWSLWYCRIFNKSQQSASYGSTWLCKTDHLFLWLWQRRQWWRRLRCIYYSICNAILSI